MSWYPFIDNWIVITAALSALACALLGNFLVLRHMSMMGDAISHAVLPGLAIAFMVSGSRASLTMFVGAVIAGVLTAVFTQWISQFGNVDRGASMGIVFTTLFALGLVLIVRAADHVDLDPSCVLYGAVEFTPLDIGWTLTMGDFSLGIPRASLVLAVVVLVNLLFVVVLFKELRLSSFDPALATTLGYNATLLHYLIMSLVAITTVASFEAVGSIIVIAMLIVPAATAHLLTDRLGVMVILSAVFGVLAAGLGHVSTFYVPGWLGFTSTSTSGMMAVVAGLLFLLTAIFAPRHGILARLFHTRWQRHAVPPTGEA